METLVHYGQQVQSLYEAFNRGDIPSILSSLHRDAIWEVMGQPDVPFAGIYHGPADVKQFFGKLKDAIDVKEMVVEHILENGNMVIATGFMNATGRKSGKHFSTIWSMIYEFDENEEIVHFRDCYDTLVTARAIAK
ncbi:MAG TPA: nuclear transport factor 2 family protein [Puia sp.]